MITWLIIIGLAIAAIITGDSGWMIAAAIVLLCRIMEEGLVKIIKVLNP